MGTVYRGIHVKTKVPVAIKMLAEPLADDENFRQRFNKEIEALRQLRHPNIVRLLGYGQEDEKIEEIWAFVDSSGSIVKNEMEQFLTQLYRIAKEFSCVFNLCYWDTEVTDVYRKIRKADDIFNSLPKHSGGTEINCVYRWLKDNKVRPDVMLILTDGFFGTPDRSLFSRSLAKKTILVLSGSVQENEDMRRMGRITRLEEGRANQ